MQEWFPRQDTQTKIFIKSPLEMVVGAARELNADVTDTNTLAQRIADLGEPLYGKWNRPAIRIRETHGPSAEKTTAGCRYRPY